MTVHHHDPDRIMALAAGTLPDTEARLAAGEVAACEQCSTDLDHQRIAVAALAALGDDPAAALTDLESRRLRRSLLEELAPVVEAPVDEPPVAGRRRLPLGPLVAVAAVFVAVVVGGNAIRSLSPDDDSEMAAEVVAADTATTAPGSSEAPSPEALTEDTGDGLRQSTATPTTAAAAAGGEDAAPFVAGATEATTAGLTVDDLALVWEEVTGARLASEESTVAGDAPGVAAMMAAELVARAAIADDADAADSCVGAAAAFTGEPVETAVVGPVTLADLGPTVLVVTATPEGTTRLLVHDPVSCAVVTEVTAVAHP
jgi:hypothetical protein